MPGTYAKPKAYNRIWWIDVRAAEQPEWAKIAVGISSRGNSINEQSQDYYDMEGRGVAESEVTSVAVTRTFTGWRAIGDKAQDAVMERLYDLDNRTVDFIECYDNMERTPSMAAKARRSFPLRTTAAAMRRTVRTFPLRSRSLAHLKRAP